MYSLGLVNICVISSQIRDSVREVTQEVDQKKKFLKTGFNKFMIIEHPPARFYVSF